MKPDSAALLEGLIGIASLINWLVVSGVTVGFFVVCLKVLRKETVDMHGLEAPISVYPVFALYVTCAHGFLTWLFLLQAQEIEALNVGFDAWNQLRNKSGVIFYQMHDRLVIETTADVTVERFFVSFADPTVAIYLAFIAVNLAASILSRKNVPIRIYLGSSRFGYAAALGVGTSVANWAIGSQWAIAASRFLH